MGVFYEMTCRVGAADAGIYTQCRAARVRNPRPAAAPQAASSINAARPGMGG